MASAGVIERIFTRSGLWLTTCVEKGPCGAVNVPPMALIILIAGVIAFPASWQLKLIGIAIGCVAVQGVNVIRVISLYYLGKWDQEVFEFAHLYLWQALIMLEVLVVWLLWIRAVAKGQGAALAV